MFKPACLLSVYTVARQFSHKTNPQGKLSYACMQEKTCDGINIPVLFLPPETQQRHTHTQSTNKPTGRAYCHPLWRNSNINICRRHRRISNRCEMFSQFSSVQFSSVQGDNYVLKKAHMRSTRLRSFLNVAFETDKFRLIQ